LSDTAVPVVSMIDAAGGCAVRGQFGTGGRADGRGGEPFHSTVAGAHGTFACSMMVPGVHVTIDDAQANFVSFTTL
jgi:hypothetical protein